MFDNVVKNRGEQDFSSICNPIFIFLVAQQVALYLSDKTIVILYSLLNYSSNIEIALNVQTINLRFIVILEHLFSTPEKVFIKIYWKQVFIIKYIYA